MRSADGPGEFRYQNATLQDHIRLAGCRRFALTYEEHQTGANQLPSVTASAGRVVTPYTPRPAMRSSVQPFPDEVIVQRNPS
jgi:hypothetical protein